jgi:hypothetical protein
MGGVLAMIAHLYGVEKVARQNGLPREELRLVREQGARPMLIQLHEYLLLRQIAGCSIANGNEWLVARS